MRDFESIVAILSDEIEYARSNYIPIIRDESGKFLYDFVKSKEYKNILEIGTAIGYSGSLILSASDCKLTTIEKKPELVNIAKQTFEKCGYLSRVDLICGDAKDVLKELIEREKCKFDMIFLDGAKGQYISYLPNLVKLLDKDGVIFADNIFLGGLVEGDEFVCHKKRAMVMHLRDYLETIQNPPYETEIIRMEDGIAITKYKGE